MTRAEYLTMIRKYYLDGPNVVWKSAHGHMTLLSYGNGIELFWDDNIYRVGYGCCNEPDGFQMMMRKHILDPLFSPIVPKNSYRKGEYEN